MNSLFIGRWQCKELHAGHKKLIQTVLDEGKSVVIAIRNTLIDKNNPYTVEERREAIKSAFGDKVEIIVIPDIAEVCYGRKVGWEIREIRLDEETESISASQIRKKL